MVIFSHMPGVHQRNKHDNQWRENDMKIKTLQLGKYKLKWREREKKEVVDKTTVTRTKPKHTDVSSFFLFSTYFLPL